MTKWNQAQGWEYHHYPRDVDASVLPLHGIALGLWRSKCDGKIPSWSDFDLPFDLEGMWGRVAVYDSVPGEPHSFDVRLWGSQIVAVIGYDTTGSRLRPELPKGDVDASTVIDVDLRFARYILDNTLVGHQFGPLNSKIGDLVMYEEILLPLSSDGLVNDKLFFFGVCVENERR